MNRNKWKKIDKVFDEIRRDIAKRILKDIEKLFKPSLDSNPDIVEIGRKEYEKVKRKWSK